VASLLFTEAYYSGDGPCPQESAPFSSDTGQKSSASNLLVIENISILAHLNHGEGLNTPFLEEWLGSHSVTEQPHLLPNVHGPILVSDNADYTLSGVAIWFTSCSDASFGYLPELNPNWLLV
jgi:hypothetical protein